MDLHNNDIGIKIALETPENEKEVTKQLSEMLYPGETLESVRERFPGYTDREILYIKKAIRAVYDREASIIWDAPGNNLTGEE